MVILKITAPDYKQSITMTITEDSTIRQLIFDVGKNFEEKGVHIEDIINWGLFFEPLLQNNNNNDNKSNNNNNNIVSGKSGGGKIKSLRLSSSKGEGEGEKKKGKIRSSSKTPLGEGDNNSSSSPSPPSPSPLSSSKGFRLLSLRTNKSPVSDLSSSPLSPSSSSPLSSSSFSDPSLPPSEGYWLDKKSLLYSLSLPDFSHLLFKRRQDITSVMEEKRKTAGSPQLKGKFDIGSNENSKVQYLLKGRLTRNEVVNEVLSTEKSYVSQLETLVKVFVTPAMEKGIFLNHYILDMFNQVKTIHSLHCEVLYQLEKKVETWSPSSSLGDVFLPIIPYLKMYGDYCLNYESNILDLLQLREDDKHVSKFIKECEMDPNFTLAFDSYLIVPVQRIPRYRLLFEQVVKYTPEDHVDYPIISNTLAKINEVANYINTYQGQDRKMFETNGKIANYPGMLLEPSRKFIREGMLKKISSRASQERRVFLFSDLLVYCTPKKIPYSFKGQIPITPAVWINHDTDDLKKKAVQVVGEEKTYTFVAHSLEEKEKWITSLNKVIDDHISLRGEVPKNEIRVHQRGGIWKVLGPKI